MPNSIIWDPTFSTIRWRIDSLSWRLKETGGPKRLESGIYGHSHVTNSGFDEYFSFSIGFSTRSDDVNSLNWFIRLIRGESEILFPCTFWLEAADRTPLCDRQSS